jgi:hypothetical protein
MLGAAAASAGITYAVYHFHTRRRMEADVRSILEEYVPLASPPLSDPNDPGDRGSLSGGSAARLSRSSHDSGGGGDPFLSPRPPPEARASAPC